MSTENAGAEPPIRVAERGAPELRCHPSSRSLAAGCGATRIAEDEVPDRGTEVPPEFPIGTCERWGDGLVARELMARCSPSGRALEIGWHLIGPPYRAFFGWQPTKS